MVDVVIVKSNSIIHDVRVGKIARSLSKRYSTLVLGWNRESVSMKILSNYGVDVKCFNIKAPYGKSSIALLLPLFWIWVFFKLIMLRPKIVHGCDFDAMPPAYIYKILLRKKLVFDVFDRLGMKYLQKFKISGTLVGYLEEWFAKRSDVLSLVSEKMLRTFREKPKLCALILNCPEDHSVKRMKAYDNLLTLTYTGNIVKKRGIERVTEAMKNLEGVELIVAGRILDKEFFNEISSFPNVIYKGHLSPMEALELEGNSDVIISLYDLSVPNYNLAMPNKTFEAMMFGIPTITNVALEVVDEVECGIKVKYDDLSQVKSAIISLRDNDELRKKLGANGRMAFEKKYNWGVMEQELYKIYDSLLDK